MLSAYIYKDKTIGPCSNGGISERHDEVLIVNADGPWDPNDHDFKPGTPRVKIVEGNLRGTVKAVPVQPTPDGGWEIDGFAPIGPMMGGCYIATADSRYSNLIESILGHRFYGAVPLHDRFETQEQYDTLSR